MVVTERKIKIKRDWEVPINMFQDSTEFGKQLLTANGPNHYIITWNWVLSINFMIPQIQWNSWCMYKFLNVEVASGDVIIYNSRIGPSSNNVLAVFARLIIGEQDIAQPATKHIFVMPNEDFFSLSGGNICLFMNLFTFVHFNLPHTNAYLRMMFFNGRCPSTLWRMAFFMHDHKTIWKFTLVVI